MRRALLFAGLWAAGAQQTTPLSPLKNEQRLTLGVLQIMSPLDYLSPSQVARIGTRRLEATGYELRRFRAPCGPGTTWDSAAGRCRLCTDDDATTTECERQPDPVSLGSFPYDLSFHPVCANGTQWTHVRATGPVRGGPSIRSAASPRWASAPSSSATPTISSRPRSTARIASSSRRGSPPSAAPTPTFWSSSSASTCGIRAT